MTHSHFAAMGGLVFDTSNEQHNFLPGGRTRVTLNSRGVCALAEVRPDLLRNLTKEQILDKSKTDGLGKTLACLQAVWFCTQCISRLAMGLSVSLLEVNTFAHALCTLFAYMLWWNKPQDVIEPLLVQGPKVDEICAILCMKSSMGFMHKYGTYFDGKKHECRIWHHLEGVSRQFDFGILETLVVHRKPEIGRGRPFYSDIPVNDVQELTSSLGLEDQYAMFQYLWTPS
jgi:hypothetical protein